MLRPNLATRFTHFTELALSTKMTYSGELVAMYWSKLANSTLLSSSSEFDQTL